MKVETVCDWCGKHVFRYPSQIERKTGCFCSRSCLAAFRSRSKNPDNYPRYKHEHLTNYNREHNSERMTDAVRQKLSDKRYGSGDKTEYRKRCGRHEHRIVAEMILGRPLRPGEVVHHIDGDKKNNSPENLYIFASQKEHASWHAKIERGEVMPNEVPSTQLSTDLH